MEFAKSCEPSVGLQNNLNILDTVKIVSRPLQLYISFDVQCKLKLTSF